MKVSNWEIWMLTLDLLGEMTSCAVPTVAHSGWGSSVFLFYGVGDIYIFWFCFVLGPPWWCPLLNPGIALRSYSWWGAGDWTWAGACRASALPSVLFPCPPCGRFEKYLKMFFHWVTVDYKVIEIVFQAYTSLFTSVQFHLSLYLVSLLSSVESWWFSFPLVNLLPGLDIAALSLHPTCWTGDTELCWHTVGELR